MRTATRTITYYDGDDDKRGKEKTSGKERWSVQVIHDGLGCASAMRDEDEGRKESNQAPGVKGVCIGDDPSVETPYNSDENALKKRKNPNINIPASDKQDNYFYQSATTCQRKIYGTHDGTS